MADVKDLIALKQSVEELRRDVDRSAGALEQTMAQLKQDWGCSSLSEAKKKLVKLKQQEDEAAEAFDELYSDFVEKWGDTLGS